MSLERVEMTARTQPHTENSQEKARVGDDADVRMIALRAHKFDSRDLFIGTREVLIEHGGEHYRLRLTAQNKLILTK
jgi:hemin uptake protein HemP